MRDSHPTRTFLLLFAAFLYGVASSQAALAETTVPVTGIGTSVTGDFVINTHADSVTYTGPVDVTIHGIPAVEIRGTVAGVGWGGAGLVARAANEHYHYEIPFVARWRRQNPGDCLVFYNHGGGPSLIAAVKREKLVGAANSNRFAELNGDLLIGVPALLEGATYVSINRRGLRGHGTFSATYLPPVAPLTAAEVTAIGNELAAADGDPGFVQPGITAGAPVPALPTNDLPTCRDITRALEQVIAPIQQRTHFRTRIATGTSSGARLCAALNFGRSVIGTKSVRTGGNHVVPYDAASPRIFDGFILMGFGYTTGIDHADSMMPLSAPVMFFQGQGEERYQQHVTMAHELLKKGVILDSRVWIYEIKNLTHVARDNSADITTGSDGDRLGCFLSPAIHNLRARLEAGTAPALSYMAGRIVNGMLQFDQAGGTISNVAPIPNDPQRDTSVFDVNLTPRPIGSDETTRWLAVTAALPHARDAITPPTVACRLGGYKLMFFGSQLVPLSPAELVANYGSFECYRAGVCRTVECLHAQNLYDPRVESASETAERARALFSTPRLGPAQAERQKSTTKIK